jgi:Pin2-interacting protein X1
LKDDNLGLGAKPRSKKAEDEPTGIDAFQDLLSRLNGKSEEEIATVQRKREDAKLLTYVEKRWKTMRFVKGGLLVQDKMPESTTPPKAGETQASSAPGSEEDGSKKAKKRHKREKSRDTDSQREVENAASEESQGGEESVKLRRDKKEKRKKIKTDSKADSPSEPDDGTDGSSVKKSKKRKEQLDDATPDPEKDSDPSTAKSLKKKKRKEKTESSNTPKVPSEQDRGMPKIVESAAGLIAARERRPLGRHIIRSRHIQQKKMALMDSKSLNEVCLVCCNRKTTITMLIMSRSS